MATNIVIGIPSLHIYIYIYIKHKRARHINACQRLKHKNPPPYCFIDGQPKARHFCC